jgi:hypothetical protein
MEKCCRCEAETMLFVNGFPLCVKCAEETEAKSAARPKASVSETSERPPQANSNSESSSSSTGQN